MSDRKQRSYGYISPSRRAPQQPKKKKKSHAHTHAQKRKKQKKRKQQTEIASPNVGRLIGLLFFPIKMLFKLLGVVFRFVWKLLKRSAASGNLFSHLIRFGAIGSVCGLILLIGLFAWYGRDLPNPDKLLDKETEQSTKIYDRSGEHKLYEIFADEKRTLVPLDELPEDLINGLIATEDSQFYTHHGVRPLSIARSIVYGLAGKGRIGGGASTITQQLVKNVILTNERKIERKVKEIILALQLERKYSKEQILQIYFNEVGYGSTNYGVEAAAQSYFGKSARDLTLSESATLAGFPQLPTTFLNNPEALRNRRNLVLYRMYDEGFISEEEKNAAQAKDIVLNARVNNIQAPHFVLYVKEQLVKTYGEQLVETGGLKVITTLDWDKQQAAEETFETVASEKLEAAEANNAALVAIDPNTAQILAMKGSRDYFDQSIQGQFNVITLGKRQPGSSFKPILYAAAFEKGFTPETVVYDVSTNFAQPGVKEYRPSNYDLDERGPVTLRQALQGSLNIPAVKAAYLVGDNESVDFAQRLGYSTFEARNFGLALVLGGGGVIPLEHAAAYTSFANGGIQREPVSILRVEDANGNVLEEWKQDRGKRVIEKDLSALISNVMADDAARAYMFGEGGVLTLPDRPVAAKTGTTNNYVDSWTVGYTPQLVTIVWAGNTDNTPMRRGYGGSRVAAPIWQAYMKAAHRNEPVIPFAEEPKNDAKKAALRGSHGGGITLRVNKVTGNLASSSTPERYIVERTYTQAHSLLHYVDKEDPRGPVPENPNQDPQYAIWETAIEEWIQKEKEENPDWEISVEEPPKDFDSEDDIALIPTLTVLSPRPSSTLVSREIETDIRVSAPRGVKQVRYLVDGRTLQFVREHPFNLRFYDRDLEAGSHVLTVIAEDDIGNFVEENIPFFFEGAPEPPSVTWPNTLQRITADDFPFSTRLSAFKIDEIAGLRIFRQAVDAHNDDTETRRVLHQEVDTFIKVPTGDIAFTLTAIPPGNWLLTLEVEDTKGDRRLTSEMRVEVE